MTAVFFASGAAALMFEIVWFHRCGLAFGVGVRATTIVLSSFMGGLAIGNALAGCAGGYHSSSACSDGRETSAACQQERYKNVP